MSLVLLVAAQFGFFSQDVSIRTVEVPVLSEPPIVDGRLDEPAWDKAAVLEEFTNFRPVLGDPATHGTRVRVYRDGRNLHFAIEASDPDPALVRATLTDRDRIFEDDGVVVLLDPYQSGRRGFYFGVNPYGIQADCVRTEDPENEDCSWDAVFFTAGRRTPDGYVVEMTIPFASVRFDPARDDWGINVMRLVPRNGEKSTWAPLDFSKGGLLEQSGSLSGMKGISTGATFEFIPELTTRAGPGTDTAGGLYSANRAGGPLGGGSGADFGFSAKVARAGIAADVTANPDFSQVESDAGQIGLNERFALYFEEKRPFFLEGRETFRTPWEAVYSRTMVDPLYGLKLSGKAGGTTFAVLHALDQSPAASVVDGRWNKEAYGGHDALSTAVRASTELTPDATMGLLFTDKHVGNAWNRAGGLDGTLRFLDTFRLTSQVLWSGTDHPDGSYEEGAAAKVRFMRFGRHYNVFAWYEQVDPGFRAEMGFIPRAGYRETGAENSYRIETGRSAGLKAVQPGLSLRGLNSMVNDDTERIVAPRATAEFATGNVTVSHQARWERFSGEEFLQNRSSIGGYSAPASWFTFSGGFSAGTGISYFAPDDPYLGGVVTMDGGVDLRPVDRMKLSVSWRRAVFSNAGAGDAFRRAFGERGEDVAFDANILRGQTQVFLTRAVSTRVIGEWSDVTDTFSISGLLAYRPGPGTVMYLGYQEAAATHDSVPTPAARALFIKLSYLFRH